MIGNASRMLLIPWAPGQASIQNQQSQKSWKVHFISAITPRWGQDSEYNNYFETSNLGVISLQIEMGT